MRVVRGVLLACVAVLSLGGLAAGGLLAFQPDIRASFVRLFVDQPTDGRDASWRTPSGEELIRANNDHFNIAVFIAKCFPKINIISNASDSISGKASVAFLLNMQPNGEETWGETPKGAEEVILTNYQRSIVMLSQFISRARSEFAAAAGQSRGAMVAYQWLIVAFGALTTVLISIKSMATNNSRPFVIVGVLAVIFSAAGTALSSMNSYLGPNETYVRSERALLQLRQIHMELGLQVAQEKDLCAAFDPERNDDPRVKRISDLTARFKEVAGSTSIGSGTSSSNPGSSSPSSGSVAPTSR